MISHFPMQMSFLVWDSLLFLDGSLLFFDRFFLFSEDLSCSLGFVPFFKGFYSFLRLRAMKPWNIVVGRCIVGVGLGRRQGRANSLVDSDGWLVISNDLCSELHRCNFARALFVVLQCEVVFSRYPFLIPHHFVGPSSSAPYYCTLDIGEGWMVSWWACSQVSGRLVLLVARSWSQGCLFVFITLVGFILSWLLEGGVQYAQSDPWYLH